LGEAKEQGLAQMDRNATVDEVFELVRQLSTVDKVRLIERVAPEIERELMADRAGQSRSLLGLVKDLGPAPTADEIDACRQQAWASIERDDI
jgi:dihydroneopterin aldolase